MSESVNPSLQQPVAGWGEAPSPSKKPVWLFVLIGVLLLAMVGFLTYWFGLRRPDQPVAPKYADLVTTYLQALADSDAKAALSTLCPTDQSNTISVNNRKEFLTDGVLAASNALAPLKIVSVQQGSGALVDAKYVVGSQSVSQSYIVATKSDQSLCIYHDLALSTYPLFSYMVKPGIGMAMNGVALESLNIKGEFEQFWLFPGAYSVTTTNRLLAVTPSLSVAGTSPAFDPKFDIGLAPGGNKALANAATAGLNACLLEKAWLTKCGFGFAIPLSYPNVTLDKSTISWSIIKGSSNFSSTDFVVPDQYSMNPVTKAWFSPGITVQITVYDTAGGKHQESQDLPQQMALDFTDPDNITLSVD